MSRVKQFARHLRDNVRWEDEAYENEAFQMYADAINEAAHGWFPRSFRVWITEYIGAFLLGGCVFTFIALLLSVAVR